MLKVERILETESAWNPQKNSQINRTILYFIHRISVLLEGIARFPISWLSVQGITGNCKKPSKKPPNFEFLVN